MLKHLGYVHIDEAEHRLQARRMIETGGFDFVVNVFRRSSDTGIDLLRSIRANPDVKDIPVLMVAETTADKPNLINAIEEEGLNDYIEKPFTAQTFEKKMNNIFEKLGKP